MSAYSPMVIAAARILAKQHAEACGTNAADVWTFYAEDFKAEAQSLLDGCGALELLGALQDVMDTGFTGGPQGKRARAFLSKATGEQQ